VKSFSISSTAFEDEEMRKGGRGEGGWPCLLGYKLIWPETQLSPSIVLASEEAVVSVHFPGTAFLFVIFCRSKLLISLQITHVMHM